MKIFRLLILVLFFVLPATAITYVGGTSGSFTLGQVPIRITYSPTTGNLVMIHFNVISNMFPLCFANDSGQNNLGNIFQGPKDSSTSTYYYSYIGFAKAGTTSYYCGSTSYSYSGTYTLVEYSAPLGYNIQLTGAITDGVGTTASGAVTTEDNNDVVVCGIGAVTKTLTLTAGTQRQTQGGASAQSQIVADVTKASPGTATCSATLSASDTWVVLMTELKTVAVFSAWTPLQMTPAGYTNGTPPPGCSRTSACCTWQIAPTLPNTVLACHLTDNYDGTVPQRHMASCYTCTSSAGCTSVNAIDTIPSAGVTAQSYSNGTVNTQSSDGGYLLSGAGGANYATACRDPGTYTNERFETVLYEAKPNIGTARVDTIGANPEIPISFTHNGVTTTPTGTDFIIQSAGGAAGLVSLSLPYNDSANDAHMAYGFALTSSGVAPVYTWSGQSSQSTTGMAFGQAGEVVKGYDVKGYAIH